MKVWPMTGEMRWDGECARETSFHNQGLGREIGQGRGQKPKKNLKA